jgi:hypothetical protein
MATIDLRKLLSHSLSASQRAHPRPADRPPLLNPQSLERLRGRLRSLRGLDERLFNGPPPLHAIFPPWSELGTARRWSELWRVLQNSGVRSEARWNKWGERERAGLLNAYAKMQATRLDGGRTVFSFVRKINRLLPSRTYLLVDPALPRLVSEDRRTFHAAPWGLHTFEGSWRLVSSFKTYEREGNLHLTFARNRKGEWLADVDIDRHQGLGHVADVLLHALTREDTDPYEIREVLIRSCQLDPGYRVVRGQHRGRANA